MTIDLRWPPTRAEAARINAARYQTGRVCKRGHLAERWTANATCAECIRADRRDRYRRDRPDARAYRPREP